MIWIWRPLLGVALTVAEALLGNTRPRVLAEVTSAVWQSDMQRRPNTRMPNRKALRQPPQLASTSSPRAYNYAMNTSRQMNAPRIHLRSFTSTTKQNESPSSASRGDSIPVWLEIILDMVFYASLAGLGWGVWIMSPAKKSETQDRCMKLILRVQAVHYTQYHRTDFSDYHQTVEYIISILGKIIDSPEELERCRKALLDKESEEVHRNMKVLAERLEHLTRIKDVKLSSMLQLLSEVVYLKEKFSQESV
ncbi:hypothetical protein L218DRAFT_990697 [Marasmius fiardii PR-910]|nr:hypothetical protein L218DRAFT_990697 [Marasmius fiardii PR-910]